MKLGEQLARFIGAAAVQVDLVLNHPFTTAQLAQNVGANAGPAKRQLVVGMQKRVDFEFVRHRRNQHQLIVLASLVGDRRVRSAFVLNARVAVQRRDVADRIAKFVYRS